MTATAQEENRASMRINAISASVWSMVPIYLHLAARCLKPVVPPFRAVTHLLVVEERDQEKVEKARRARKAGFIEGRIA